MASDAAKYDEFIAGLTAKLNAAGVPATPSWPDAIDWLIAKAGRGAEAVEYEYRAVAADDDGTPDEYSRCELRESAARDALAYFLRDYADPPYLVGWIERRPVVQWERVPGEPG